MYNMFSKKVKIAVLGYFLALLLKKFGEKTVLWNVESRSLSGSRREKMTTKIVNKFNFFRCWMFSFEG
jgi:hypothetical protein